MVELLRVVGDLTGAELAERGVPQGWLTDLAAARRVLRVRIAGEDRWVGIEDAARLRDALGVALPVGVAEAYLTPVADPLGDLVARYARTHAPFSAATCAARFGLGVFVVEQALRRLAATGRVVSGEFVPDSVGTQWCDAEVLRLLRRRSLAALRREIEPVPPRVLAGFLPRWQQIGSSARGVEAVAAAVEQLQGTAVPASAWERLVLPARVADYSPPSSTSCAPVGRWSGPARGRSPAATVGSPWRTRTSRRCCSPPDDGFAGTPLHDAVLDALADGQALFFRALADRVGSTDDAALTAVIWDLVWAGRLTNDTLAPLRAALGAGGAHRSRPAAPGPATAAPVGWRCPAGAARPQWPGAGRGCRSGTPTRPGGPPPWPTCCSTGTGW